MVNRKMNTCVGAGIFNLDSVIIKEGKEERLLTEEVGGTCGNVMAILAYMGWKTFPIARLDDSDYGIRMRKSLEDYGTDTRFVTNTADGGTTLLKVTHRTDKEGNPKVNVRASGPQGGGFPNYRFVKIKQAEELLAQMDFVPDVFFFDAPNAGHRLMAEAFRNQGSLVYFEPGSMKDKAALKSIALSHIIKFSQDTIPDVSFTEDFNDKLFIQTLGADGICFNFRQQGWKHLPPVSNPHVVDWEGAGDWTSSTFIAKLAEMGCMDVASLTETQVIEALSSAQETASQSVSYMGSKGMMQRNSI